MMGQLKYGVAVIALGMAVNGTAYAQQRGLNETPATTLAYAAGYKAGFTCSATFNGAKSLQQIAAHELSGIYPPLAEAVAKLPAAEIDRDNMRVSVTYSDVMPPRVSQWRAHLGCVQLPVGATTDIVQHLPRIDDIEAPDARADNGLPWKTIAPLNGGERKTAVDLLAARAIDLDPTYGANALTTAILVATPDAILAEHYTEGYTPTTSQRTWSTAKSIAASVIGVAVEQGLLDVKAPTGLPEWSRAADPRRLITLENLLHMASGLDSNRAGNTTNRLYWGGGLATDTSSRTGLEATPGSRWKYANNDTVLAVRTLRAAIDDDAVYQRFPFENLLYKIGMTHTKLETDWEGNFILSSQVWTTARDLARLGLLHLADGVWEGERLLPAGWAEYVATPAPSQPARFEGRPSVGYGAQWWLYNNSQDFPGVPEDTYASRGNRGNLMAVIPSLDLLIVRRGYDPAGGQGFQFDRFIADVVAALEDRQASR